MKPWILILPLCLLLISGCTSASTHLADVRESSSENLTVGKVQREIKVGMTSAEVASVLGSPNIVSTDEDHRENWIYDKIATDNAYSTSGNGILTLIIGPRDSGATSTAQRTLTIIIKFDREGKVRDFAYHSSRF